MSPNKSAEVLAPTPIGAAIAVVGAGSTGFKKSPRRLSLVEVLVVGGGGGGGAAAGVEPAKVNPPNNISVAAEVAAGLSAGLGSSSSKSSKLGMGVGGANAAGGDTGGGGAPVVGGATTPINAMTRLAGSLICARLCWTKGAISPLHAWKKSV